jgi:hypothetical protein
MVTCDIWIDYGVISAKGGDRYRKSKVLSDCSKQFANNTATTRTRRGTDKALERRKNVRT